MGPSHGSQGGAGCWREASAFTGHLASGLRKRLCDTAAGSPHSEEREGRSCNVSHDLILEVTHGHVCNNLSISQADLIHGERGLHGCGHCEAGITGATSEAGCHDSASNLCPDLGPATETLWAGTRRGGSLLALT